ncbi:hypothetical protein PM082_012776 [Marasmius tenuissimus]|nr:hypothetical protein PM082_012776 [Marasmius tenuissimus]
MDQPQPSEQVSDIKLSTKPPVVRGARACTTCRAAKMKCVGADDGQKQCQRCKRAGVECIFEKHRRGRKPGSKLSEASKMLRRLEKGLNTAKLRSQTSETGSSFADGSRPIPHDRYGRDDHLTSAGTHFPSNELPPLTFPGPFGQSGGYPPSTTSSRTADMDEDDDPGRTEDTIYPAKLIRCADRRHSFFRTILNPEQSPAPGPSSARSTSPLSQSNTTLFGTGDVQDPVSSGLIDENQAKVLFDLLFLRLNPFINMFDPSLHSVPYVRKKSPFLFTVLLMAGCKFFEPKSFKACQKLANELAVKAFMESWKSVEVVQAFACLTYWRDSDDNRTWTYIGYACRMAVELGLNQYVPPGSLHETDLQYRERRNKERTYLILFVHDRSLSTQTGKNWMLPEDEFIRHSMNWHEHGLGGIRPEDVIVSAFVQLRHIAAETTETFRRSSGSGHSDINYEVVLRNCNNQLTMWMDTWEKQMKRAGGETFHFAFLSLFRLYIRLFTNSFGVEDVSATPRHANLTVCIQATPTCYTSAIDALKILSKDFKSMCILRYGQDTVTMMSAYAAVFLLKLLRNPATAPQLPECAREEVHSVISQTAAAYDEASAMSPASSSAATHARFLRHLITHDNLRSRKPERERYPGGSCLDSRLPAGPNLQTSIYPHPSAASHDQSFHFPASHPSSHAMSDSAYDTMSTRSTGSVSSPHSMPGQEYGQSSPQALQHNAKNDEDYWKNMFIEIGFGSQADPTISAGGGMTDDIRSSEYGRHLPHPIHASPPQNYGH